jgi:NHL repeat
MALAQVVVSPHPRRLRVLASTLTAFAVALSGAGLARAQSVTFAGPQPSVNFGIVNICPAGQTTPAPCSAAMTLNFNVTASGTLGTPQALTLGAPDLDFTLASGSTCTGSVTKGNSCTVNTTFAPRFAGLRRGGVEVVDGSGNVLADVPVYGIGSGPQVTFQPGPVSTLSGFVGGGVNTNLAVDGSGNIFFDNGLPHEILAAGGYTTVKTLSTNFSNPVGIAVDGSGNVYVNDYDNNALQVLLAAGGVHHGQHHSCNTSLGSGVGRQREYLCRRSV